MQIRRLRPDDDRRALSGVYEASWRWAYRGLVPQEYLDSIPAGRRAEFFDTPGMHTLLAEDGGLYAGTASFCSARFPAYEGMGELVSLYLLPEYTGRGLGAELLRAARRELAGLGYGRVFLWVLEENRRARAFYERHGFVPGGEAMSDCIGGRALREVVYVSGGPG